MSGAHIIDERRTRDAGDYEGKVLDDIPMRIAWCGKRLDRMQWSFLDASHALMSLKYGGGIGACRSCLRKLLAIIQHELEG